MEGKVLIIHAFICRTENAYQLPGEEFHYQECRQPHRCFPGQKLCEQFPHPTEISGAYVEAHHRDAAGGHADHNGNYDLKELHDDSHHCHGDLGILLLTEDRIQGAVFADHVIDGRHGRHQGNLGKEACQPQYQSLPAYRGR